MKYTVSREKYFSAAHHLREYDGKCENIHGHNWRVIVFVSTKKLDNTGFVVDFKILDSVIDEIFDILDHQDINNIPPFDKINPTAENIAAFILQTADEKIKVYRNDVAVEKVKVWESEKSCATVEL